MPDPKVRSSTLDMKVINITFAAQQTVADWIHESNYVGVLLSTRDADLEARLLYGAEKVVAAAAGGTTRAATTGRAASSRCAAAGASGGGGAGVVRKPLSEKTF